MLETQFHVSFRNYAMQNRSEIELFTRSTFVQPPCWSHMFATNMNGGKSPCKKMNWLKDLLDDDGDSSDATPKKQKLELMPDKKLQKISKLKPHRSDSRSINHPLTGDRKQQHGGDIHVKKKPYEIIRNPDGKVASGKLSTRRQDESGERRLHHKNHLEDNRVASMKDAEREKKQLRRQEKKDTMMIQRKRPHAESKVIEREKVELHWENTVNHGKAKAAAQRQRRMKKLRARRMATGEHERLAAAKLKRQKLSEASRLKRNQRVQIRKTQKLEKLPAAAELAPEVKEEGKNRVPPLPSEEAREGKRMLTCQFRAAIKEKKQLGAGMNSSLVSTLKRAQSVDSDVRHGLGADYGDKASQKRQKRKHMKEGHERASGSGKSHVHSPKKTIESQAIGETSVDVANISKVWHEDDMFGTPSFSDNTSSCISESRNQSAHYRESCHDKTIKADDIEEGQVDSPVLVRKSAANPVKQRDKDEKKTSDTNKDLLLDMAPIPRKSIRDTRTDASASSFVIPKHSVKIGDGKDEGQSNYAAKPLGVHIPVSVKPMSSPESDPQLSSRDPISPQQKRTKNPVPVKSSMFSAQDRTLMRLARKRNSIFLAAAELTAQLSSIVNKVSAARMTGYDICDKEGNVLPDLVLRLSCATKRDMASDKDSFNTSYFGVSQVAPKAKGKACPTVDECANVEGRKMNCYEKLRFERPEDREIYQRRMYGSTFVPQHLRGRTTLVIQSAHFERKSIGIRFNQDRDREEFAASLRKRYTFNKTVPRCEIPRENWQKIMRNQLGVVYLHYNNREHAERAARVFRDDNGNPLELKNDYKSRMGNSRNHSPAIGVGSRRTPRRSCLSEQDPPKLSPLPSQDDSARTPQWQRERQWTTYRYSRCERPPSAQRNGQEDHYGPIVGGRRSRSRSKSRSRPKRFSNEQLDPATKGSKRDTGNDGVRANKELLSEKPYEPAVLTRGPLATEEEVGNAEHPSSNTMDKSDRSEDTEANAQQRAALPMSPSPRTAIQSKGHHDQDLESGEEEQEDGEIESSTVSVAESIDRSKDRGRRQRSRSSPRSWRQRDDVQYHQRQGDYSDRPYTQHYNRGPSRQRSRSRSRPRPAPWGGSDLCDAWNDSFAKERHSRDYDPVHDYDNDGHGRRMYSGELDRYGGRDYRGGYKDRRAEAYSRRY